MNKINPYVAPGIAKNETKKELIKLSVCSVFKIEFSELLKHRNDHHPEWVKPRHFIMYFMKEAGYSLQQCGLVFGKNHSTALWGHKSISNLMCYDWETKHMHDEILGKINFDAYGNNDNSAIDEL